MHLWYKKAQIKCNIFFFHVWERKLYILLLYLYGGLKITVHVLYTFKLQQVVYHVHAHYTWGSTPLYLDLLIFSHCTSTSSPVPFSTGFSPVKIIIVNENFVTNCISLIFLTKFLECCLLEYPMFFSWFWKYLYATPIRKTYTCTYKCKLLPEKSNWSFLRYFPLDLTQYDSPMTMPWVRRWMNGSLCFSKPESHRKWLKNRAKYRWRMAAR